MSRRPLRQTVKAVAVAVATTLTLVGCSAGFSPERLPTPQSMRTGWTAIVEFPTVVNLPESSKVMINGVDAGVVSAVRPHESVARVTLTITDGFVIGRDATVELRQDTLLGDTYVAIANTAQAWSDRLPDGGVLGAEHVKKPVQVEDLMISLANFLGSGSLPQLGTSFAKINAKFPADPADLTQAEQTLVANLRALADNPDHTQQVLHGLWSLSAVLAENKTTLESLLSDRGVEHVRGAVSGSRIIDAVSEIGIAVKPLLPAVPLLNATSNIVEDVLTPLLIPGWPESERPSNAAALMSLIQDKLIPYLKDKPGVDIRRMSIEGGVSNAQLADRMVKVFRTLGVVR